jgi:hypothetical protein
MDYRLLEFLGNYFLYAAKYQKQTEDLQAWIKMGGSGFQDIAEIFTRAYGLDGTFSKDEYSRAFQTFYENYTGLFSVSPMIPEEKYLALKEKYETLLEKYEDQKRILENLSSLSTLKDSFQENLTKGMDQVTKSQKEIIETILDSFSKVQKDSENNP